MAIGKKSIIFIIPAFVVIAFYSALWAYPIIKNFHQEEESDAVDSFQEEYHLANLYPTSEIKSEDIAITPPDSGLVSPIPQPLNNPLEEGFLYSPFHLSNPPSLNTQIYYDTLTNTYVFRNMIGNTPYGPASSMDINEFINYDLRTETRNYWKERGVSHSKNPNRRGGGGIIPQLKIGGIFLKVFLEVT